MAETREPIMLLSVCEVDGKEIMSEGASASPEHWPKLDAIALALGVPDEQTEGVCLYSPSGRRYDIATLLRAMAERLAV